MACGVRQKLWRVLKLPAAYEADVWFKLPMYLPSTVEFLTAAESKQTDFLIRNVKSKSCMLRGTVKHFNTESYG